jgi:hypothetical protein
MLPIEKTKPKATLSDLITLVYGRAKIGKSTFCSKAPDALFLACEPGLNSLEVFQVPITTWEDMLQTCAELAAGNHTFKTIIIDTVDILYKHCSDYICKTQKITHPTDSPYGKGFALVNNEFQRVLNKLAFLPYGLILISHTEEKEIEKPTGKYTRVVPSIPEKARRIVTAMADLIVYCDIEPITDANGKTTWERVIRTKPCAYYEAGDRTGKLPDTLPLDYDAFVSVFENEPNAAA